MNVFILGLASIGFGLLVGITYIVLCTIIELVREVMEERKNED